MRKPLPAPAVLALIVAVGLLVLAVGWFAAVRPLSRRAADLRRQSTAVRQQIADELAQASPPRGATGAELMKVANVYKLAKAMPSTTDMPDVLLELDQTAQAAGVQLLSVSPTVPTPGTNGYSHVTITLTVAGDFYAISDLLYRLRNLVYVRNGALEASGRLFSVDSVALTPVPSTRRVSATLSVDTYVYGGAGSTATSTAPSSTTPTTATTTASSGASATGAH